MRASFFEKLLIIFRIFLVSLPDTVKVIIGASFFDDGLAYADRVIHEWARKILGILRVNYQIIGSDTLEFDDSRPYIVMSNHASHFDIPLIYEALSLERVGMIAKRELFKIPLFGRGMRLGRCIPVDRDAGGKSLLWLAEAKRSSASGVRIWIAPEGTRSIDGRLGSFKKGGFKMAVELGAIILPVTIIGSSKILPAKSLDFSFDEEVRVEFGEVIDSKDYRELGMLKLMEDVKNQIASKLV